MPSLSLSSVLLLFIHLQAVVLSVNALNVRVKRGAYQLPAGVEEQTGLTEIKKTFKCEKDGYYSDIDNECKLYHICNGRRHDTMACGANQRFDQSKLVCNWEDNAIPCEASEDFFYLNERIGDEKADFLTAADIDKAKNARPEYKAAKARARRAKGRARARARARA